MIERSASDEMYQSRRFPFPLYTLCVLACVRASQAPPSVLAKPNWKTHHELGYAAPITPCR